MAGARLAARAGDKRADLVVSATAHRVENDVRDHRTKPDVRDHRRQPNVRDHRQQVTGDGPHLKWIVTVTNRGDAYSGDFEVSIYVGQWPWGEEREAQLRSLGPGESVDLHIYRERCYQIEWLEVRLDTGRKVIESAERNNHRKFTRTIDDEDCYLPFA
jgi:hypothetical protein